MKIVNTNPDSLLPLASTEKNGRRLDIASIRREQIVEAATHIIVSQGLQNLSLSKIEERTGMKRGQLTYYFPSKEEILLAVFDRLLQRMIERMHNGCSLKDTLGVPPIWDMTLGRLTQIMLSSRAEEIPFSALQYTFLSQVEHREDYRKKLAEHYSEWRDVLSAHWNVSAKPTAQYSEKQPRVVASFIQALCLGLNVLLTADPNAFDKQQMLEFCIEMISPLFVQDYAKPGEEPSDSQTDGDAQ